MLCTHDPLSHTPHISDDICTDVLWRTWGSFSGMNSVCALMASVWQNILNIPEWHPDPSSGVDFWLKIIVHVAHEHQECAARESCQAGVQHCRKTLNPLDLHRRWFEEGTVWSWREAKPSWRHRQHSNAGSNQLTIYIPRRLFMRVSHQELHQQTKRIDCSGGTRESSHQQQEKGIQSRAQPPNLAELRDHRLPAQKSMCFTQGLQSVYGWWACFDLSKWDHDLPWLSNTSEFCLSSGLCSVSRDNLGGCE